MAILNLSPNKFRNLTDAEVAFDPQMNIIVGQNASGKTSLLEAIYVLLTGKSFRSNRLENIICRENESDEFMLFGNVAYENDAYRSHRIGIKKSKVNKSIIKVDDRKIQSASELVKICPVIIIDPTSFELLYGGPSVRRKFMDWGVFHVEHLFAKRWSEYIYCLKQRNTLLRAGKIDRLQLDAWDRKLAPLGEQIHRYRDLYANALMPILKSAAQVFQLDDELAISYVKGWDKNLSLSDSLAKYRDKDCDRKHTQFGPHRADLKLRIKGVAAEETLSRGQQKLLVMAMYLSHAEYLRVKSKKNLVVLIDDVGAELDAMNLAQVLLSLRTQNTQVICTALELNRIEALLSNNTQYKVFHVEHGNIEPRK